MVRLTVEDVSLCFPLYSKAHLKAYERDDGLDERILVSPKGRIMGVQALRNISFDLKSGDKLGLIGVNGSGKTTLLQVISQIIAPDTGRVHVEGRSSNLININLGVQPGATAHRNITLRGLACGETLKSIDKKRDEIIEFAELGEFVDFPVETFSAGMRMRLNFAIATAFEPEILILDEWLSAGDIAFRKKAASRMNKFVEKAGILVVATHTKALLESNCDRVLWIDDGRIRMDGRVDEVWGAYAAEQQRLRDEQIAAQQAAEREAERANAKPEIES